MGEQKVTRKNHPLLVKARQEGYQQGYRAGRKKAHIATIEACNPSIQTIKMKAEGKLKVYSAGKEDGYKEGFEAGRRSIDNYINTLHNQYKYLINNISYVSFDEIKFVYQKETDPHFVDTIAIYWRFNHKDYGRSHIPYHNLPLLCERLNEVFERKIADAKREGGETNG
jgi:flagellar biosynthesis/type III secretory pathway protein FliH